MKQANFLLEILKLHIYIKYNEFVSSEFITLQNKTTTNLLKFRH